MSSLSSQLDDYLTLRRSLGFKLTTVEKVLRAFVRYAQGQSAQYISTSLFVRWREDFGCADNNTWAARLNIVRIFAQWLQSHDANHEVPPDGLIRLRYRRRPPYIFSERQVHDLVAVAAKLSSEVGLRPRTYSAFLGLIAVTGLRLNEAISLNVDDVDLVNGILTVRDGKNGSHRQIPLSKSTVKALTSYAAARDEILGGIPVPFFISDHGQRLAPTAVHNTFNLVSHRIGLRERFRCEHFGPGPRIHDLRHTFAARIMINWYRQKKDVDREILKLTTVLGHQRPEHTYWYIEAVPELLHLASARASTHFHGEARS